MCKDFVCVGCAKLAACVFFILMNMPLRLKEVIVLATWRNLQMSMRAMAWRGVLIHLGKFHHPLLSSGVLLLGVSPHGVRRGVLSDTGSSMVGKYGAAWAMNFTRRDGRDCGSFTSITRPRGQDCLRLPAKTVRARLAGNMHGSLVGMASFEPQRGGKMRVVELKM